MGDSPTNDLELEMKIDQAVSLLFLSVDTTCTEAFLHSEIQKRYGNLFEACFKHLKRVLEHISVSIKV